MTKEMKFEEALDKLENIVKSLEEGELPLDDSLAKFEQGMRLSEYCTKRLDEVQGRIEKLTRNEKSGELQLDLWNNKNSDE